MVECIGFFPIILFKRGVDHIRNVIMFSPLVNANRRKNAELSTFSLMHLLALYFE